MLATELANWLRDAGLRVEEVAGWQGRGHGELRNDVANMVVVDHHTAGGPNGRAPSLSTCLYGVPGVPGPLCNVMQTRESDGNDVFMVLASGVSYNAGTGGWAGVSGNWSTIGLEVEHTGVDPYPNNRADLTQRFNAAVLKGFGQPDGSRNCQHFEWSDTGKIDIGTPKVDANWFRQKTTEYMHGGAPPAEDHFRRGSMVIYHNIEKHDPDGNTATGEWVAMFGSDGPTNITAGDAYVHAISGVPWVDKQSTLGIVGLGVKGAQARKASAFWDSKLP